MNYLTKSIYFIFSIFIFFSCGEIQYQDVFCDKMIYKQNYHICYSYKNKGAKYVSYALDGNLVNKNNIPKRPSFYAEKEIENKYQSKPQDYYNTPYDRGHLASDASFDYDEQSLKEVYSMANIIPQYFKTNRYSWIKTEKLERKMAVQYGRVDVFIGVFYADNPKTIGNKVSIPYAYYKKISNHESYEKCFYFKNDIEVMTNNLLEKHIIGCNNPILNLV